MVEPVAKSLSQFFSQLTDRHVSFTFEQHAAPGKLPPVFAVYAEMPRELPIIARADVAMVAVLASALLGLPDDTSIEGALATPRNEPVRDAMHEVLNIGSTALSTSGRVVLQSMVFDPAQISGGASQLLKNPSHTSTYRVAIDSTPRGVFTLLS